MKEKNDILFDKFLDNKCSEEEVQKVFKLAETSDKYKDLLGDFYELKALRAEIDEIESIDLVSAKSLIHTKVKVHKRNELYRQFSRIAAVLFFPLIATCLFLSYNYLKSEKFDNELFTEVKASPGTIVEHILPDKSKVILNAGTKIKYPTDFLQNNQRSITLVHGEAYFEVQADKKSPFYVHTANDMSLYVYGTKFNVRSVDTDSIVEVVLETGHLNVYFPSQADENQLKLEPGDASLFNKNSRYIQLAKADIYEKTAWSRGELVFRNTSLDDILEQLADHFNVEIEFTNPQKVNYKYRATFKREETLNDILKYLSKSAPLNWEDVTNDPNSIKRKIRVSVN